MLKQTQLIIKIIQLSKMKIIIILASIILLSNCRSLTVTCVACSISCPSEFKCYRMVGDGFDEQVCSNEKTCTFSTIQYQVEACDEDFNGQKCSEKVCIGPKNIQFCHQASSCQSETTVYTCGTCKTTSSCTNCLTVNSSSSNFEGCADDIFSGKCNWSLTEKINLCAGGSDFFSKSCNCCISYTYAGIGFCASSDLLLSSSGGKLSKWINGSFETFKTLNITALMVVLLVIFY